jgi:molecular chaperone GrpE
MKDKKNKPKEDSAKALRDELDDLQARMESVRTEKDELFAKLQRISADFANFQKRVPKQISDSVAYEKESVIRTLLPALDNLEHTLANAHHAESLEVVIKGVEIIYSQMLDILKGHGVEQIHAKDEKFDPSRHEAMMRRAEPDKGDDVVLEEFQKGYVVNGRVVRPAKVVVNKIQGESPTEPTAEDPHEAPPRDEAPEQAKDAAEAASPPDNETES